MLPTETAAFADWLRAQLQERGWGVRTLARKINPSNPEVPRRAINHYLRGTYPTERYAAAIALALELPREELPIEEVAPPRDPFRADGRRGAAPDRVRDASGDGAAVTEDAA